MPTPRRLTDPAAALIVVLIVNCAAAAPPPAKPFTYQGQLKFTGAPLDGTVDMKFSLWDAAGTGDPPAGGNQVGHTLLFGGGAAHPPPVVVTRGLFTVALDFGAAAASDDARWLQIAVRSPAWDGTGTEPAFVVLGPRQSITAAPLARKTLGISPRQVSALEADNAAAGFVTHSEWTLCTVDEENIECEEMTAIELVLADGAHLDLELMYLVGEEQARQFEIEKHRLEPFNNVRDFVVNVKMTGGSDATEFSVSPADPVHRLDPRLTVRLAGASRLIMEALGQVIVTQVVTESQAEIQSHQVDPYNPFAQDVIIRVSVRNTGSFLCDYIVSVTDCTSSVEQVPAQIRTLADQGTTEFVFTLHNSVPFTDADSCKVTVKGVRGLVYATTVIDFPPPTVE